MERVESMKKAREAQQERNRRRQRYTKAAEACQATRIASTDFEPSLLTASPSQPSTPDDEKFMHLFRVGNLGAGHLPIVLALIFTATLGLTYCISVYRGDVDPMFPYISASGDNRPESCLFGMMLSTCVFFSLIVIYLRFGLIRELNRSSDLTLRSVNIFSFYIGMLGAFGMFIVANFQETALIQVHLTGAITCFGCGCVYMVCQAWCTHRMVPLFCSRRIGWIRTVLATAGVVLFVVSLGLGIFAAYTFHKYFPDEPTPRPWNHRFVPMPGYTFHCISAIAEWLLAVVEISFFLSYSREFEKLRVNLTTEPLVHHLDESPMFSDVEDDHGL